MHKTSSKLSSIAGRLGQVLFYAAWIGVHGCRPGGGDDTDGTATVDESSTSNGTATTCNTGCDWTTGEPSTSSDPTTTCDTGCGWTTDESSTASGTTTTCDTGCDWTTGDPPPPPVCGDGVRESPEGCDLGDANDDAGVCTSSCQPAVCGDGLIHTGVESCDDGNTAPNDACANTCGVSFSYTPPRIVAGDVHTCVLSDSGAVRCWGGTHPMLPQYGQLGQGHADGIGDDPGEMPPLDVDLGKPAIQVVAGTYHTCALLQGGAVKCWGQGESGALGTGSTDNIGDQPGEMPPPDVDLGGPAAQLAAGSNHTCALMASGTVGCWGSNQFGQAGENPVTLPPTLINLTGEVIQLSAGSSRSCALLESGVPICWGGILGEPREPRPIHFGGFVVELAHSGSGLCARLSGGQVRCMGDNVYGYGHSNPVPDPLVAGDIPIGGPAKRLFSSRYATCSIIEAGDLRCWGLNYEGQLGYGHTDTLGDDPGELPTPDVDLGGAALDVALGFHSCARMEGGAIRCWGEGQTGSLGYGAHENIGDQPGEMPPPDVQVY